MTNQEQEVVTCPEMKSSRQFEVPKMEGRSSAILMSGGGSRGLLLLHRPSDAFELGKTGKPDYRGTIVLIEASDFREVSRTEIVGHATNTTVAKDGSWFAVAKVAPQKNEMVYGFLQAVSCVAIEVYSVSSNRMFSMERAGEASTMMCSEDSKILLITFTVRYGPVVSVAVNVELVCNWPFVLFFF